MIVLAIETTTRAGSLALVRDDRVVASVNGASTRTHAERLPREAIEFLATHGLGLADVTLLAVVSGPGSFTGIRVGMAAVQGLAFAGRQDAIGIGSLEATVEAWLAGADRQAALVCACLDAARGEVYFALNEVAEGAATLEACRQLMGPAVAAPSAASAMVARFAAGASVVFVGDGAERYAAELAAPWRAAGRGERVQVMGWPVPLAEGAARIAARRGSDAGAPHALRPIYVRRPDVELASERKGVGPPAAVAISISRATSDDIESVERLQRATFSNPWGAEAIRWEMDNTDVARLYVMRDSAELVGYCACWVVFDELHINSLATDPGRRRKGLARHLLKHVLSEAQAEGATSATLEVRASNIAARRLYEGLGFSVEAVRRDYYQQPREDALILWKRGL